MAIETYELSFSLYLKHEGIPPLQMGAIFAIGSAATILLRIYIGHLSDHLGRKGIYSASAALCGIACVATPHVASPTALKVLRTAFEGTTFVRSSMHALYLYDRTRRSYRALFGGTLGFEVIFQGIGALAGGALIARLAYVAPMTAAGIALLIASVVLVVGLPAERRTDFGPNGGRPEPLGFRSLLALDMGPELRLITLRQFIFTIGFTASHCFIMQQWFAYKFGMAPASIGLVQALHRFAFGIPLIFVGRLAFRRLRLAAFAGITIQGLSISAATLMPDPWTATAVWLVHDAVGAAVWNPINSEWTQRFARASARGRQSTQSQTIAALGGILGPLLAGWCLARGWVDGPFMLSGLITVASAVLVAWLPRSADAPEDHSQRVEKAHQTVPAARPRPEGAGR